MTQLEVKIDEKFSKVFSIHLDRMKSHQNDLFDEWLQSLPKLELLEDKGDGVPEYNWVQAS